jgi:hypothetical protein
MSRKRKHLKGGQKMKLLIYKLKNLPELALMQLLLVLSNSEVKIVDIAYEK